MTPQEKILLVEDLSSRMIHGVKVEHVPSSIRGQLHDMVVYPVYGENDEVVDVSCQIDFFGDGTYIDVTEFKPVLRKISSMTKEEISDLKAKTKAKQYGNNVTLPVMDDFGFDELWHENDYGNVIRWLKANQFDCNGLIELGLAIEQEENEET